MSDNDVYICTGTYITHIINIFMCVCVCISVIMVVQSMKHAFCGHNTYA